MPEVRNTDDSPQLLAAEPTLTNEKDASKLATPEMLAIAKILVELVPNLTLHQGETLQSGITLSATSLKGKKNRVAVRVTNKCVRFFIPDSQSTQRVQQIGLRTEQYTSGKGLRLRIFGVTLNVIAEHRTLFSDLMTDAYRESESRMAHKRADR